MRLWRWLRGEPGLVNLLAFFALTAVAAGWLREHDQRVQKAAIFRQELKKANADAWSWQALWVEQAERVAKADTVVTQTVTRYRTLHDTLLLEMAHSDGHVPGLPHLPVFLRVSDSVAAACTEFQVDCAEYRRVTDSLVASLRRVIAVHETRADPSPPRFALSGAALYDPIRNVPALDAELGLRVVAGFSLVARAEDRLGESPRLYVGVRRAF